MQLSDPLPKPWTCPPGVRLADIKMPVNAVSRSILFIPVTPFGRQYIRQRAAAAIAQLTLRPTTPARQDRCGCATTLAGDAYAGRTSERSDPVVRGALCAAGGYQLPTRSVGFRPAAPPPTGRSQPAGRSVVMDPRYSTLACTSSTGPRPSRGAVAPRSASCSRTYHPS